MKAIFKAAALVFVLLAIGAIPHAHAGFTNVYNFSLAKMNSVTSYQTNSDGAEPFGTLVLSGKRLYGTTAIGGLFGMGTVFALNTDGSGFTNLHNFTLINQDPVSLHYTNYDGANPSTGLALSNGVLYGVTTMGGAAGQGTVFAIGVDGSNFTNLYSFQYSTGGMPFGALIVAGNKLYGTTTIGGTGGGGTVFGLGTGGSSYTNIHQFSNGEQPYGTLLLSTGFLYGTTTSGGGAGGGGTAFKVKTDGTGFTNLVQFGSLHGITPYGGLVLSGSTLYGTTELGGTNGTTWGTIFSVNTDGSAFTTLRSLNHNNDGAEPFGGLFLSGNTLYGTTYEGGMIGAGTVFKINTDGSGFSDLYNFTLTEYQASLSASTNSDGADSKSGVILSGGQLYGTTTVGGPGGSGVIFALSATTAPAPIPLNIALKGGNVILTWSDASFSLYSAPVVGGPYTNLVSSTSPYTNAISGSEQFFRLQAAP